jgi:hypothetical protein
VLLAGAGGASGISIAFLLLRAVLALHPPQVPGIEQTTIDGMVLAFSVSVSMAVGVLFGLAPAIEAARIDVNDSLREQASSGRRGFGRQRSLLVIAETALSCMLLIATGLALRSLWSLRGVELGFVPGNVLTFRVAAPSRLGPQGLPDFYRQTVDQVRAVPGVESAAVARDFPLGGADPSTPILTEGKAPTPVPGEIVTRYRAVSDDYFRTLQIPLLQGRAFGPGDTASSPAVAIVSESLARKYWPGENAVGKRLKPKIAGSTWCEVVGVAADVRHWGADVVIEPTDYYPYSQVPESTRSLVEGEHGNRHSQPYGSGGASQFDQCGRREGESERSRVWRQDDGFDVVRCRVLAQLRPLAPDRIFTPGAFIGCRWSLRSDGVFGLAAHPGDRRSHGAWRKFQGCDAPHSSPGHAPGYRWSDRWSRQRIFSAQDHGQFFVWTERERSDRDVHRPLCDGARRPDGLLAAGTTRNEDRSNGRSSV